MFDLFSYFSMLGVYKGQNSFMVVALFGSGILLISGLNIILIPRIGVYGAAIAFCVSKAALFFIPLVSLRKHFKLTLHSRSFIIAGGVAIVCSYLLYKVEWYAYCLIIVSILSGTGYYLYKKNFYRILFYHK